MKKNFFLIIVNFILVLLCFTVKPPNVNATEKFDSNAGISFVIEKNNEEKDTPKNIIARKFPKLNSEINYYIFIGISIFFLTLYYFFSKKNNKYVE